AISRQALADLIHRGTGMPHSDAVRLVDRYCDEHAPSVPHYLQEEFAIPYMKVLAILVAVVSIAVFYYSVVVYRSGKPNHYWLVAGTLLLGVACLFWVKSLELWAARKNKV